MPLELLNRIACHAHSLSGRLVGLVVWIACGGVIHPHGSTRRKLLGAVNDRSGIWADDLRSVVRDWTIGPLLAVPVVFLVLLAKNKIDGLAVSKGLFFVLALGAPGGMPQPEGVRKLA